MCIPDRYRFRYVHDQPELQVPLENIVALTFTTSVPGEDFRSWLQPIRRVVMTLLVDPALFGISVPGHLLLLGIAPRVNARTAVTHWDFHGLRFSHLLPVAALESADEVRLSCSRELAELAFWLFLARNRSAFDMSRLQAGPHLPRTLCAVPPAAVVEPAATKYIWDLAYTREKAVDETYAFLYERLCVSPRDNPTKQLLIDTRLINHLRSYPGFPGSRGEFLDLRNLRGRPIANPFSGRGAMEADPRREIPIGCSPCDIRRAMGRPHAPLVASGLAKLQTLVVPFCTTNGLVFQEPRSMLQIGPGHAGFSRRALFSTRADALAVA